ncbi:hypothetical protein SETIT_5G037300v2 [Setaria italica]|uniref:Uncharacterized protein n=1 Tax=Setaria italica TaxID=4555 RepID=A0A368R194_SETIT|nr:hypothetical protein SETIT_5G037300v2 [Setaria italica]
MRSCCPSSEAAGARHQQLLLRDKMASLGGGGDADGDPKQKLGDGVDHSRQQHAAGMRLNYYNRDGPPHSFAAYAEWQYYADRYKQYYDAASDDWQSNSSSSTCQMLGGQHRNGSSSSASPSSGMFMSGQVSVSLVADLQRFQVLIL